MAVDPSHNDLAVRLTNVDLNLIPALLALLQERSVTRAAQRIGLSQPAMSHTLARLRRLIGDDLLVRSGAKSTLTPRGRSLLDSLPGVLQSVSDSVLRAPDFDPTDDQRHFVLSMTPSTAFVVSPTLLRLVEMEAPSVSFEIRENAPPGADIFGSPELDLAIVADTVATSYERTILYRDRWVAVVSENSRAIGDELSLAELAELPHIAYRSPALRLQPYIALAAAGIEPRLELVSPNFLLIPMLVADSDRIAIVQERLALALRARFALRVLELPLIVPRLGIDLVWNPRLAGDSATEWLVGRLKEQSTFTE